MTRPFLLTLAFALLAPTALAETYTVQPGDTAYSIARRAGLSVEQLLHLNNLPSADLRVGQPLQFRAPAPASVTYVVQQGDTAYNIARRAGISVEALLQTNQLSSADLRLGQALQLPLAIGPLPATPHITQSPAAPSAPAVSSAPTPSPPMVSGAGMLSGVRDASAPWLGAPYAWGGTKITGVDCSGFTMQIFAQYGVNLPHQSAQQFALGQDVPRDALTEGDLVFFDTEGRGTVTHVGIYLGDDEFVNANSYTGRVSIDKLSSAYFAPRYLGARRITVPLTAQRNN